MEYLSYDPVIPLLGICPEKTIIQKDTCTPVFTVALFTIAKTWKQPKCSSTEECIKKSEKLSNESHSPLQQKQQNISRNKPT